MLPQCGPYEASEGIYLVTGKEKLGGVGKLVSLFDKRTRSSYIQFTHSSKTVSITECSNCERTAEKQEKKKGLGLRSLIVRGGRSDGFQ